MDSLSSMIFHRDHDIWSINSNLSRILLLARRGAFLLLDIFFHATIFGALLKPPPVSKPHERNGYFVLEDREEKTKPTKENDCFSLTCNCFLTTTDSLHLSIFKEPICDYYCDKHSMFCPDGMGDISCAQRRK